MPEYLSTREVAQYLRLNQKKVYAMVAAGQLPAARISGKWLFPKHLIDQWVSQNTVYPTTGIMGALLDEMIVLQGSDDWLLSRVLERFQCLRDTAVPSAPVGSVAGLRALAEGKAHVASCHVDLAEVRRHVRTPSHLVSLFTREQGLMFDRSRTPRLTGLTTAAGRRLRFAERQEQSGTYRLVRRLLAEAAAEPKWTPVGPFTSHLELALAIRNDQADAGVGARVAATLAGLDFVPLATESFDLLVPGAFTARPRMSAFLEFTLDDLRREARHGVPGYSFQHLGRMQPLNP